MPDLIDLYVAFGLLFAVIVVFIATRMGVLPKKKVPVILGALAGVLGVALFRRWQSRALDAQIGELKNRIADRDARLATLAESHQVAEHELAVARASLDRQLESAQKQRLQIVADNQETRRKIEALDADATIVAYQQALEEEARAEAARGRRAAQPAVGGP